MTMSFLFLTYSAVMPLGVITRGHKKHGINDVGNYIRINDTNFLLVVSYFFDRRDLVD